LEEKRNSMIIFPHCCLKIECTKRRVFNIKLGDSIVVKALDVCAKRGTGLPYDEQIPFDFKNDQILIKGQVLEAAYQKALRKITLTIEKVVDHPRICGIVLYRGSQEGKVFMIELTKNHAFVQNILMDNQRC
jgi:hypothetical protein